MKSDVCERARLDPDGTAKGKTEIVMHVENNGQCIGPESAESYSIRETEPCGVECDPYCICRHKHGSNAAHDVSIKKVR